MDQIQCSRNHMFNPAFGSCPHCTAEDQEVAKTKPYYDSLKTSVQPNSTQNATATVGLYGHLDMDPVVGWLVCIGGPDKGRDWRLTVGRNVIGRGDMAVNIDLDNEVSRSGNAILVFEPRKQSFTLLCGDGGLCYVNGDPLHVPTALHAYDKIEVGKSTLMFIPFSGPKFDWEN
jgi:hypothetical protein